MSRVTKQQIINFIDEKEFVSYAELNAQFRHLDNEFYLTLHDLLMSGDVRRVGNISFPDTLVYSPAA